jgi:hypothetical protein
MVAGPQQARRYIERTPADQQEAGMPAKTEKQRRFMGAELSRARAGKKTRTGMSEKQLKKFAKKK